MKIMTSGPITSWQIDGETMETVTDFIFLGSKITADGDCSHEIKRWLLLGRKALTSLDSIIKKQRHYFADKIHLVKAMVFPVVMYGCESWTVKKAEHQRIDAFELWCWRRLLKSSHMAVGNMALDCCSNFWGLLWLLSILCYSRFMLTFISVPLLFQ